MTGIRDAPDPFDGRNDSVTWRWSENSEHPEHPEHPEQCHDTATSPFLCPTCGKDLNERMVEFVRAAAEEAAPERRKDGRSSLGAIREEFASKSQGGRDKGAFTMDTEDDRCRHIETRWTVDQIIFSWAAELQRIYDNRTAGDHTFSGALGSFLREVRDLEDRQDKKVVDSPPCETKIWNPAKVEKWPHIGPCGRTDHHTHEER